VSDTPTPRTDAFFDALYKDVPDEMTELSAGQERDFARQLERELSEVTKQRDEWFEAMKLQTKKLGDAQEQLKEARDLCAKWEEEHAACLKTAEESANLAEQAMRQRDALADAVRKHLPFIPDMEPIGAAKHAESNVTAWELRKALATLEGRG
jgi:hypothetical protein